MNLGILKIKFELEEGLPYLDKELSSFCEKIANRFKVVCKPTNKNAEACIFVTSLNEQEQALHSLFNKIMNFSETSGFGRIVDHTIAVDDLEFILADEDDDED